MAKKNYENVSGRIVRVMISQYDANRVSFQLNVDFPSINKDGKEENTNTFGINVFNLVQQIGMSVPEIALADTLSMGQPINPQIIALAMQGADIEIKREFKAKGEKREGTNDTYANDCIVSKFDKVTTHILPQFAAMLANIVATKPAIVKAAAIPNPFAL